MLILRTLESEWLLIRKPLHRLWYLVFILDWDADELLNAEENVGLSFPFL